MQYAWLTFALVLFLLLHIFLRPYHEGARLRACWSVPAREPRGMLCPRMGHCSCSLVLLFRCCSPVLITRLAPLLQICRARQLHRDDFADDPDAGDRRAQHARVPAVGQRPGEPLSLGCACRFYRLTNWSQWVLSCCLQIGVGFMVFAPGGAHSAVPGRTFQRAHDSCPSSVRAVLFLVSLIFVRFRNLHRRFTRAAVERRKKSQVGVNHLGASSSGGGSSSGEGDGEGSGEAALAPGGRGVGSSSEPASPAAASSAGDSEEGAAAAAAGTGVSASDVELSERGAGGSKRGSKRVRMEEAEQVEGESEA